MHKRKYSFLDRCVMQIDWTLRPFMTRPQSSRTNPADNQTESVLSTAERQRSIGLMRVNHAGEISARALYQVQALTAKSQTVKNSMSQAAAEELDHLIWCKNRLQELESHTSYLNPIWYFGSFALGALAGWAGDQWSLGFVAETERQVVNHLQEHLRELPEADQKSRAILQQMCEDESHHATVAQTAGARELPPVVKRAMNLISKIMTRTAYWI
jgi:3-demethoxyubiquinol 3-hydroxylase